ncbi:MAG: hypothetical protein OEZ08_18580 [Betaproteobacteria bacterium]|nr:hypothetical protein [Betaproteobacteria bacterium]
MSFKTHVFISYAHADNPEVRGQPGWVTQFDADSEESLRVEAPPRYIQSDPHRAQQAAPATS